MVDRRSSREHLFHPPSHCQFPQGCRVANINNVFFYSTDTAAAGVSEPTVRGGHRHLFDAEADVDRHSGRRGYQSHSGPGRNDTRTHDGYAAYQHHQPAQDTHAAPGLGGTSHGESSMSSTDTSNWSMGSSPIPSSRSSIPRTPQDSGIAPGHHLGMGYGDKDTYQYSLNDPAMPYMYASTASPLPRSVAVDAAAAQAISPTSAGCQYRHSHASPGMAWPPSDSTMNSAIAGAFYRERAEPYMVYSIPAEGSADMGNCVPPPAATDSQATAWAPSSSHRFAAANSEQRSAYAAHQ